MTIATSTRRWIAVLYVVAVMLSSTRQAEALYMEGKSIERPIDWTLKVGSCEFGIAEEVHVREWFFNELDGREVLSVGTAIYFGAGAVTVPCRFVMFVTAVVGLVVGVIALSMLPSLQRRWSNAA